MVAERKLSFAEIVQGRDASVRMTDDNLLVAVDLVMLASGKNKNDAGKDLRDLKDSTFSTAKFTVRTLPGKGNANIKLVSLHDAIELFMVLPGKLAKETRSKFADVIRRYLGGDKSLITEIEANAASDSPIAQLARASLDVPAVGAAMSPDEPGVSKKRERDTLSLDLVLAERKLRLEEGEFRLKEREKALEHMNRGMDLMDSLKERTNIDERTKLQFEDHIKNVILSASSHFSPARAITNGAPAANDTESLSVSVLVGELGYKCSDREIINIGRAMAKKYREKYQQEPPKHKQYVKGNYIPVNSYMERDRSLMEEAVREIMSDGSESGSV